MKGCGKRLEEERCGQESFEIVRKMELSFGRAQQYLQSLMILEPLETISLHSKTSQKKRKFSKS